MAKPYSQDLRDRVIGAVDSGMSARAASRLFGISESTGIKWVARGRRTGSIGAKRMGGYKRSPLDSHVDLIVELITEQSDLTVEEIRSALRERGIRTGHGSVRRFFDRHGISFKKTVLASEQDRADVAAARQQWRKRRPTMGPHRQPTRNLHTTRMRKLLQACRICVNLNGECSRTFLIYPWPYPACLKKLAHS